jgi:hypothetical protein
MRSDAGIRVRQPLSQLSVRDLQLEEHEKELIRDELNIKDVVEDASLSDEIALDTQITC